MLRTATSTFTQLLISDIAEVSHHLIHLKENRTKEESWALSVGMNEVKIIIIHSLGSGGVSVVRATDT